ncbi:hypothetical protein HK100_009040 [Physocladia obscura]|uniref:Uncharacterized protein n=1 Tax=Physocladia obscura TaxID=109957 RepID=A0AAD5T3R5_9FUNG|nr:hypothetical protein HK100_009040 [Physocladia obscura]
MASSACAALASQSFATLFRTSKLAAVTYTSGAIAGHAIKSPLEHRGRGEWGIKYSLPLDQRDSTAIIKALDSPAKRTCEFSSATRHLARIQRFQTAFGAYVKPDAFAIQGGAFDVKRKVETVVNAGDNDCNTLDPKSCAKQPEIDLGLISDAEFAQLVQKAREFAVSNLNNAEWETALNVKSRSATAPTSPIHPPIYWSPLLNSISPNTPVYSLSSSDSSLVSPATSAVDSASEGVDARSVPITAVYLNSVLLGHAVGILGFVAFLPDAEITTSRNYALDSARKYASRKFSDSFDRKPGSEIQVYIQAVTWDSSRGRWKINVTQRTPNAGGGSSVLKSLLTNGFKSINSSNSSAKQGRVFGISSRTAKLGCEFMASEDSVEQMAITGSSKRSLVGVSKVQAKEDSSFLNSLSVIRSLSPSGAPIDTPSSRPQSGLKEQRRKALHILLSEFDSDKKN